MARGGRADAHKTTRVAAITAAGLDALNTKLTDKQREALELLAGTPTGIATPALAARGIAADVISRLARHGYISLRQDRVDRDPFPVSVGSDRGRTGVRPSPDPNQPSADRRAGSCARATPQARWRWRLPGRAAARRHR